MKRLMTLAALMLVTTFAFAQRHFTFMQTEIDGHVDRFQREMEQKGFSVHPNTMDIKNNVRYMVGSFQNRPADLEIIYDKPTKMVYEVDVIMHCRDKVGTKEPLQRIHDFLLSYYPKCKAKNGKCRGEKSKDFHVKDAYGREIGQVRVYTTENGRGGLDVVACFIDVANIKYYVGSSEY